MNIVALIAILVAELLVCLFLAIYTLTRCKSYKKSYFIGFVCLLFLHMLGYLLEVTSRSMDGAFAGLKVEYLGAALLSQISLLFIMDLCNKKITGRLIAALLIIPAVTVILVWTSEFHQYYYTAIDFISEDGINQTTTIPGPWYYVHYSFASLCLLVSCCIAVRCYFKLGAEMQRQVPLLIISPFIQILPHALYAMGIRFGNIYYPVMCLPVSAVLLFIYLMRYNVFDVKSQTYDLALDFIGDAFLLIDKDNNILHANRAAEQLEIKGVLKAGARVDMLEAWPRELMDLGAFREKDGSVDFVLSGDFEPKSFRSDINRVTTSDGRLLGWVLLIRDITETQFLMERIEGMAYIDALTGLINRSRFMDLAEAEFSSKKADKDAELSIIIVGMDDYKKINDTYGDIVGDTLLRLVSDSLSGILGRYPLFARYAGTQFILLADIASKPAEELANRIRNEIAYRAYEIDGAIIKCTACVGVASKSKGADTLGDVIHSAGEALRRARAKGYSKVERYS